MANMARGDLTVSQLRAMDYEYASHFAQFVAASVLDMVEASESARVIDHAYHWRMWAAAQARAASFDQDPFAGMLELWVLAAQQHFHFTEGQGKDAFGEQQAIAIQTSKKLEDDIRELASAATTEKTFGQLTAVIEDWVDVNPIQGRLFVRPTARADLASLVPEEKQGGLKAVGSIEETFRDLNDRITILTVQMPTEARWQAEYLAQALFEERFNEPAETMVDAVNEITGFMGEFEGILAAQTSALLAGIGAERTAIFDAVEAERQEILGTIDEETDAVLNAVDQRLVSATTELDNVGKGLIDHFFMRLIEVLAVMGVVTFLTVLLVLAVLRKRRNSDD